MMGRTEKVIFACGILLLCLGVYVNYVCNYVGDKIWLLYGAHQWLQGKKLYVDIFEVNPPLIYWLYALPTIISETFRVEDYHVLALCGFVAIAISIRLSLQILRFHPQFSADKRQQAQFCLLLASVLVSFTNPSYFFDREHIFLVLTLPYLFRWLPSVSAAPLPAGIRIATGIMAGIGFCIKPHCAVVFAWIQLLRLLRERSFFVLWSLENILIYCIAVGYAGAIWIFTPEYMHTVIPMALATYDAVNRNKGGIIFFTVAFVVLGVSLADFRLRYTSPYRKDIFYLLALCPAYLFYALLNNGWGYTWNPLISMAIIIAGFLWWEYLYLKDEYAAKGLPIKRFLFGVRACALNFLGWSCGTLILLYHGLVVSCGGYMECPGGKKFMENIILANGGTPPRSLGTVSVSTYEWPYVNRATGAQWVTRFNHLWMLPKFFVADEQFQRAHTWILDYVDQAYAQDMARYKPDLMFIEDSDIFFSIHKHVDLLQFMLMLPEFSEQWHHYRFVRKIDSISGPEPGKQHTGYYVYKRID